MTTIIRALLFLIWAAGAGRKQDHAREAMVEHGLLAFDARARDLSSTLACIFTLSYVVVFVSIEKYTCDLLWRLTVILHRPVYAYFTASCRLKTCCSLQTGATRVEQCFKKPLKDIELCIQAWHSIIIVLSITGSRSSAKTWNFNPSPKSQFHINWFQIWRGWLRWGGHQPCLWFGSDERSIRHVGATYGSSDLVQFFLFFYSSTELQPIPVNHFSRTKAQKTRSGVRKTLLGIRNV